MSAKTQMGLGLGPGAAAADAVLMDRDQETVMLNFVSAKSPWGQAVQRVRLEPGLLDELLNLLEGELNELEASLAN
jgi:hypothetical protein